MGGGAEAAAVLFVKMLFTKGGGGGGGGANFVPCLSHKALAPMTATASADLKSSALARVSNAATSCRGLSTFTAMAVTDFRSASKIFPGTGR